MGPGSYKSSLSVNVNSTLDINYVSFSTGGDTRTLYYFGCPIKNVTTGYYDVLPADDFSVYGCRNYFFFILLDAIMPSYFMHSPRSEL